MHHASSRIFGIDDSGLIQNTTREYYFTPETLTAFNKMAASARCDGIEISPVSSYRSFNRQLQIWNNKYTGKRPVFSPKGLPVNMQCLSPEEKIHTLLIWSALPGTSRHHWGTDIDIIDRNSLPPDYTVKLDTAEFSMSGVFHRLDKWLELNAQTFGFFRPYKGIKSGYQAEPWHISYRTQAQQFLSLLKPDDLRCIIEKSDIEGKTEVLEQLPFIFERYVYLIDEE